MLLGEVVRLGLSWNGRGLEPGDYLEIAEFGCYAVRRDDFHTATSAI